MEITNISAQLYNKQLKPDELASYYGCKDDIMTDYLTTCVDDVKSDAQLERTFQKQLDLSDYYKGISVFDQIKKDFMDRDMENDNHPPGRTGPPEQVNRIRQPITHSKAVPHIEVGPRDYLKESIKSKEFFGAKKKHHSNRVLYLILAAIVIFAIIFLLLKLRK